MFFVEKLISLSLLSPLPIIIILFIIGIGNLFSKRKKSGFLLILIGIFIYVISTDCFIDKKLYKLENTYSIIDDKKLQEGEVYILLGGGIITSTGAGNVSGIVPTARILKLAEFYKKYPKKIYISGGKPLQNQASESSIYALDLENLGIPREDIVLEEESKTTNENALFIGQALQNQNIKKAILITSAFHMKRSMNIFQHQIPNVEFFPAPCNFMASNKKESFLTYYIPRYYNMMKFQFWIWEEIGDFYYKLRY